MAETKKHYEAIDGLRTLACIVVLMIHVLDNGKYMLDGVVFKRFIPSLHIFVFLFMVISGFGMCCGYFDRIINNKIDFTDFYIKRYKKILPFFALLSFMDLALSPSLGSFYEVIANITLCFGLMPNANINVIGVGWFLGVVFVFYLIFPFYCFLLSNKVRAWVAFGISYVMNVLCRVYFNVDKRSMVYCFVYFMAGGLVFLYKDQLGKLAATKWISLVIFLIFVVLYYSLPEKLIIILILNCSLLVFAMSLTGKNLLNNKTTKLVGRLSFEIYLCHMVIFRLVEVFQMTRPVENEMMSYFIVVLIVFAGAMAFAFLGQQFINKVISFFERKVEK